MSKLIVTKEKLIIQGEEGYTYEIIKEKKDGKEKLTLETIFKEPIQPAGVTSSIDIDATIPPEKIVKEDDYEDGIFSW